MKGKLSAFEIGLIAAFVLIALAGGGGFFYTKSILDAKRDEAGSVHGALSQVVRRGYLPVSGNVNTLEENNKIQEQTLAEVEKRLKSEKNLLSQVTTKNPVVFKEDVAEKVKQITEAAQRQNVELPQNFYLTFSRFKTENLDERATLVLGKQMVALEQLLNQLFAAKVFKIVSIRRSFEEDSFRAGGNLARAAGGGEDLPARMVQRPNYTAYPFQADFTCTTTSLHKLLDGLMQSPYIFVVRALQISSTKPVSPKMQDLDTTEGAKQASGPRAPIIVMGNEDLQVRMRVDLVEWSKNENASAAGGQGGGRQGGQGGGGRRGQPQ